MTSKWTYSNVKDWPLRKLKREAAELYGCINSQESCFGTSDLLCLELMLRELERRGVDFNESRQLTFK
jgi:hypothetical protein